MKEIIINSIDNAIDVLTSLAKDGKCVFRGYGKQSELLPNIIREKDYSNEEAILLKTFEKYGLQFFTPNNNVDFLSYAQHFGLPTRLLDFTYNPFIALYFSLYLPKSNGKYKHLIDKDYYYIRYCNLEDNIVFDSLPSFTTAEESNFDLQPLFIQCIKSINTIEEISQKICDPVIQNRLNAQMRPEEYITLDNGNFNNDDHYCYRISVYLKQIYNNRLQNYQDSKNGYELFFEDIINKFKEKKILFIDANQCNNRIVMQQGLFMFPYNLDKEQLYSTIKRNSNCIMIPKQYRESLLEYLNTIGINAFRLMPDLQSVCCAIKRQVLDERNNKTELFK